MESFLAAQSADWEVYGLPAFTDNYLWVLMHRQTRSAMAIDPGCADTVQRFLNQHNAHLSYILLTHHHLDHIGGLPALSGHAGGAVQVIGPQRITGTQLHPVQGQVLQLQGLEVGCLEVPGHTKDHVAYVIKQNDQTWLFCGDTLFSGGCGRLFEGSPADLFESFARIKTLPPNTLVFCAHEYTESNLRFAIAQQPGNPALQQRQAQVAAIRAAGRSTVPTTLHEELKSNIFLQCNDAHSLGMLRAAKDVF